MKMNFKKIISIMLVVCVIFSSVYTGTVFTSAADSTPKVEIVSFMRGMPEDGNLRSSELLEARITGYNGNVRDLTYVWTNTLGTYLYVYNSHNMYYINGTDGEVEIYNSKIPSSTNMAGRSYKDSFSGVGYCWASIYGSNTGGTGQSISDRNAYTGTIAVKVYDGNTLLCEDSHSGEATWSWSSLRYTYDGIIKHSLEADMDNVTIGLFEGDKRNVKDLLGESAILHITCVESTVSKGQIVSGNDHISLSTENGDYYITGTKAGTSTDKDGDASVNLTIEKNECKFHEQTKGTATTTVYVFKKPTTSTTAYTLTLTGNLDERCRYFIDGKEGVKQEDGTILFDGLTPNTQYMVEVRGEYKDENDTTKYAYAYVYDTTKPIYTGTVQVYLDATYNSATHTVTGGQIVDLPQVTDKANDNNVLYAKAQDSDEFIKLTHKSTGTYSNILDTGSYNIFYEMDEATLVDSQILTMHQADRTRYLFYNSVTYKNGDEEFSYNTHLTDSKVDIIKDTPTKEGYYFAGWKDETDQKIYQPNEVLTSDISRPYVLTAQWEKGVDVYVNITIDHISEDNQKALHNKEMHSVAYDLMTKPNGSSNYEDVLTKYIEWDCKGSDGVDGYSPNYDNTKSITTYNATTPVAVNVPKDSDYTVEIAKTGYELKTVEKTTDDNGNIIINATLKYAPTNQDFKFYVELDEQAKALPAKILPVATHVKVSCWYAPDGVETEDWNVITQHEESFVTVTLNEEGVGEGTYPVWATKEDGSKYHYRIEVVSYLLPDGTVLPAKDATEISHPHTEHPEKYTEYCTEDQRYHADIVVTNGDYPDPATTLTGAYFNEDAQQSTVKAIISVKTHNVTFEPNGGNFSDGSNEIKVATNQVIVPNLSDYTVTRDGGYVFDGWYLVENDEMTDNTVNSGDELYNDITLRAKWKEPLTIKGIAFVAGYYRQGDDKSKIVTVPSADRTHHVTVYLQKILPNGYAETIDSQMMDIIYNDMNLDEVEKPMGSANYQFTQVPDDGHKYRVLIQNPNYIDKYQNEPDSINLERFTDFENYYHSEDDGEKHFMAEFGDVEPSIADVNLFLEFEPTDFELKYKINATKINEGFRPSIAEVLVLCDDGNHGVHPQDWAVITQMNSNGTLKGQDTSLDTTGIGDDSYPVWISKPDGHTLYDYAVKLKDYTINGTETQYDATSAPFYVFYNGSARYSAISTNPEHQTQLLTIELQPRRYVVTFNLNFKETQEDHVTGMDKYLSGTDENQRHFAALHLWSYETDFSDAIPKREGYEFLGWYDENGDKITKVGAEIARNVTVTAKWRKGITVTFHANNDDIDYDVFKTYYENGISFEDDGKSFSLSKNGTLESFYEIPEYEYSTHNKYIFKGWYLDKENNNDSRPITFKEVYTEDTDIYAHWIHTGNVEKDINDSKITSYGDSYPGYDLIGVQIREAVEDNQEHYGDVASGIRFVTVLSEDVYKQVNQLSKSNANGAEYGYVLAKKATADKYCNSSENYELEYKDANVNGVDTTTSYKYISNVKCSGVPDHFNCKRYRLYTAVVTYTNLQGNALAQAQAQQLIARSYIRYTDANGLFRTHYNNYISGSQPTGTYSGCKSSYADAFALTKPVG